MKSNQLDVDQLDFDSCENEKIHLSESVQGFGYLFALNKNSLKIEIISENITDIVKLSLDELIGLKFNDLIEGEVYKNLLNVLKKHDKHKTGRMPFPIQFVKEVIQDGENMDFYSVFYTNDDYLILEIEPAARLRETYSAMHYLKKYAIAVAPQFERSESMGMLTHNMVETIKEVTEMDRVILYRFNKDGSSKVLAEAKEDDMVSYMDLHHPASDIPPQVRELYTKNWVRLIPDIDMAPYGLYPSVEQSGRKPLDMTYSLIRNISPIHRQYVKNQGLKATMSFSLLAYDSLWGMISCHHREEKYIPQNIRLECESLSQLFSWHLYAKETELLLKRKSEANATVSSILDNISVNHTVATAIMENEEQIFDLIHAHGFAFVYGDESYTLGHVPDARALDYLLQASKKSGEDVLVSTDIACRLPEGYENNEACGVLLVRPSARHDYFTAWFRKEHRYTQRWAGIPRENNPNASKKERLMPRKSFTVHEVEVTGKSIEWDTTEIEVAQRIDKVFMAYAMEQQEKLRKEIGVLKLQDKNKNEFIATLAHELKNPLTPIKTGLSIIEHSEDPEDKDFIVKMIKKQMASITTMIDDLLDASRVAEGKIDFEKKAIDIKSVIRQAISETTQGITEKQHRLTHNFSSESMLVIGNEIRLVQVFTNIIGNAVKYTPPNGEIHIELSGSDNTVSVRITDNGIGIPYDKQSQIFNMFNQMNPGSPESKGGLGIGLTLVDKLVKLHNGEITVESDGDNQGSTFMVTLPRTSADLQGAGVSRVS